MTDDKRPYVPPLTSGVEVGGRILLQKIDGDRMGLLDYEPPSTTPSPGSWLSGRTWVDDDGMHVWFAHDCAQGRSMEMLPWPIWQVLPNGRVEPSINCEACGLHSFYAIEWTPYGRPVVPSHNGPFVPEDD